MLQNAPLRVEVAPDDTAAFRLENGLAYQPVTLSGLRGYRDYTLFENIAGTWTPVHQGAGENGFWQTDYDALSGTYSRTYNLPLDEPDGRARPREFTFKPSR